MQAAPRATSNPRPSRPTLGAGGENVASVVDELPRWEMESVFGPEPDAADRAYADAIAGIDELAALLDRFGVAPRDDGSVDAETVAAVVEVLAAVNRVGQAAAI